MRIMNFNPGPAALPQPVLERARDELLDFGGTGMSIMEHSHRGQTYESVHDEAIALLRDLLTIPARYDVLFLQGGASLQFAQIPLNLLGGGKTAAYVVTGAWSEKAVAEAQAAATLTGGNVRVAASTATGSSKAATYTRVPVVSEIDVPPGAVYLHLTSNETIHGVQFATEPGASFPAFAGIPLVCDMSSDFLWRKIDVNQFGFIYAGAQKNVGPSGVVVAIVDHALVDQGRADLPVALQYRTFASQNSLYNTPPTFAIYLVRSVLAWMKEQGGLAQIEAWNREKARLLYDAIDANPSFYRCPVAPGSRSLMNAVFRLPDAAAEDRFVKEAERQHMVGLKGHRSVGGIRVSLYNAIPVSWVQALVDFMRDFAQDG
jgi:phosphoserine aminotransferase